MSPVADIPAAQTALVVIDAQESFRQRPYWVESEAQSYLSRQQALVDGCAARGVPIVQVFHNEQTGVFSRASGFVKTLAPLAIEPDFVVDKSVHSALAGTPLQAWLTRHGIRRLLISGIRTEQCCETTARAASDAGYLVDYITEATLTFPMTHPVSGQVYSAPDIQARTELVLHQRFARIATVEQVLAQM